MYVVMTGSMVWWMKRLLLVLAIALLLTACGGSGASDDPAAHHSNTSATPDLPPTTDPADEPADGVHTLPFGKETEYAPGIKVTVSDPTTCDMSSDDDVNQALTCVASNVTIKNTTGAAIALYSLTTTMTSDGEDAGNVVAPSAGIPDPNDLQDKSIADGKSTTFRIGYAVQDPSDLTLEISSTATGRTIVFAGGV